MRIHNAVLLAAFVGLSGLSVTHAIADERKPTMGQWVCFVPSGIGGQGGAIWYEQKVYPKNRYQMLLNETGLVTFIDTQVDRVTVARYINVQCVEQ